MNNSQPQKMFGTVVYRVSLLLMHHMIYSHMIECYIRL